MWGHSNGDHVSCHLSGGGLWRKCSIVVVAHKALVDISGKGMAVAVEAGLMLGGNFPMRRHLKLTALWQFVRLMAVKVVVLVAVSVSARRRVRVL